MRKEFYKIQMIYYSVHIKYGTLHLQNSNQNMQTRSRKIVCVNFNLSKILSQESDTQNTIEYPQLQVLVIVLKVFSVKFLTADTFVVQNKTITQCRINTEKFVYLSQTLKLTHG